MGLSSDPPRSFNPNRHESAMFSRLMILTTALTGLALAQEPAPEDAKPATKPSVKQLDETKFQLGEITFDKKSREIRFPAMVNMTEGALEYLIVHLNGKTHESLFSTKISPLNLNVVFQLLRYPASRELYSLPDVPEGMHPVAPPPIPPEVKAGARVNIEVEWVADGKTRHVPVNEWIQHGITTKPMAAGPWVYGASVSEGGKYIPEVSGDIAAIFLSNAAILNYPGEDNANDDVWKPFPKRVPEIDTPVTIIISPTKSAKALPKP